MRQWRSQRKILGGANYSAFKRFGFAHCLSKHKTTRYARNLEEPGPFCRIASANAM